MSDEPVDTGAADKDKPQLVPAEVVDRLVEKFTQGVKDVAAAKPAPAPPAPAPVDDTAAKREAAKRRYAETREKAAEVAKDDPVTAFEMLAATIQEQAAATATPPPDITADPSWKSLRSQAKRMAMLDANSKALIERWPDEVEAAVAAMPPAKQLDATAWEDALVLVRGRHYRELADEEAAAARKAADEARQGPAYTPVGGAARAGRTAAARQSVQLDTNQLGIARSFGITPERYAAQLAELGEPARDGSYRNIPLLPADSVPKPGEF